MSVQEGQLIAGTLPSSCYPQSPQVLYNWMFQLGVCQFPNITGIVIGDTAPGVNDQDKAWAKTSAGAFLGLIYTFFNGAWVVRHQLLPGGIDRRWVSDITNLGTYDGGDGGVLGDASGPMWVEDTDFQGRSPMHPGAIPGSTPAKTLAALENYGEGTHTLLEAETPKHTHWTVVNLSATGAPTATNTILASRSDGEYSLAGGTGPANVGLTNSFGGAADGSTTPHQNTHPVRGLFAIKRSSRIYYRGA